MTTLQEIKDHIEKATPGPWNPIQNSWATVSIYAENLTIATCCVQDEESEDQDYQNAKDAEFIANARTDLPLLIRALELACSEHGSNGDYFLSADYWIEEAEKELHNDNKTSV